MKCYIATSLILLASLCIYADNLVGDSTVSGSLDIDDDLSVGLNGTITGNLNVGGELQVAGQRVVDYSDFPILSGDYITSLNRLHGDRNLNHSLLNNIIFLATRQFNTTATEFPSGGGSGSAYGGDLDYLFDGDFNHHLKFSNGETLEIIIDFTAQYPSPVGIQYGGGDVVLSFFQGHPPVSVSAEILSDGTWLTLDSGPGDVYNDGTVWQLSGPGDIYNGGGLWQLSNYHNAVKTTQLKITIEMQSSTEETWLTELEYFPIRPGVAFGWPVFTKHIDQILYKDISFWDSNKAESIKFEAESGTIHARELNVEGYDFDSSTNSITIENYSSSNFASLVLGSEPVLQFQNHSSASQTDGNIALGYGVDLSNATGVDNIAFGNQSMQSITSGRRNIALGYMSLQSASTSSGSIAIGENALRDHNGDNVIAIGRDALSRRADSSYHLIAIGREAMGYSGTGLVPGDTVPTLTPGAISGSIAIGYQALAYQNSGYNNLAVGTYSFSELLGGQYNVGLGYESGGSAASGHYNVFLGALSGSSFASGDGNTFVGYKAASDYTGGHGNIAIGNKAQLPNTTGHSQMSIGNTIYGDLYNKKVGIGETHPEANLHVAGSSKLEGDVEVVGATTLGGDVTVSGNITLAAPSGDISMGIFGVEP